MFSVTPCHHVVRSVNLSVCGGDSDMNQLHDECCVASVRGRHPIPGASSAARSHLRHSL